MITYEAFYKKAARRYTDYLKSLITGTSLFPLVIRSDKRMSADFAVRASETAPLINHSKDRLGYGYTIQYKTVNTREHGVQDIIASFSFITAEDLVLFLGKEEETLRFKEQLQLLLNWRPEISDWLLQRPSVILQHANDWEAICNITDHLLQNDVSEYYLRSLPVKEDTKFIETKNAVIVSLLKYLDKSLNESTAGKVDALLPFRKKPFFYPVRWLDLELTNRYTPFMPEIKLTLYTLRQVHWEIKEVWLVENETALYMLPPRKNALAICSEGLALAAMTNLPLLQNAGLYYWGDMDAKGYELLSLCRWAYPQTQSICMNKHSLLQHMDKIVQQPTPYPLQAPAHLKEEELNAYKLLVTRQGRLEQEKLPTTHLQDIVQQM